MKTFTPIEKIAVSRPTNGQDVLKIVRSTSAPDTLPVAALPPVRTSIQRMNDAKNQPSLKMLLSVFWMSNEHHILFADTGLGKSILAVAVADALSKGKSFLFLDNEHEPQNVLYYDFELSDRQFRKRYTDEQGNDYQFSDRFFIDNIDFAELMTADPGASLSSLLFSKICKDIEQTKAEILIIDNLTYLNAQSTQDTMIALTVMRELNQLKKKYNLSILVLAHTPKRSLISHITINDMAGSKHLVNFADSVSAIGKSTQDSSIRYIKQIKPSRSSEMVYDANNVITCELKKSDNMLTFEFLSFDSEYSHLQQSEDTDKNSRRQEIIEKAKILKAQGYTLADIAEDLLGSRNKKGTICKWLNIKNE